MEKYNEIFWGEVAPCDHLVQIYEDDGVLIEGLASFAANGFATGDVVAVIASESHIDALETKLINEHSADIGALTASERYIKYDAETLLSEFIVDGHLSEEKFRATLNGLLQRARRDDRKLRVFGEMVAVLWGQGNRKATFDLERLWEQLCHSEVFCLYCAYPKSGFQQDINESIEEICTHHSKMIKKNSSTTELNSFGDNLTVYNLR